MRNHLSALQGLSLESEPTVIQNIVGRAEHAVHATSSDLRKGMKHNAVQLEVAEVIGVLDEVRRLVLSWCESYLDNSMSCSHPNIVNFLSCLTDLAAFDISSSYTTATLIAYTLALTLRLLEGVGRTVSSFILKGFKIFGMSYGLLHPGGNYRPSTKNSL